LVPILAISMSLLGAAWADTVVQYNFDATNNVANVYDARVVPANFALGSGLDDQGFDTDINGRKSASRKAQAWSMPLDNTKWFGFQITINTGYDLDTTSITFDSARKQTNAPSNVLVRYSSDGTNFTDFGYSDTTAYATGVVTWKSHVFYDVVTNLSGSVWFRIYGTNASSTSSAWRVDNVTLNGATRPASSPPAGGFMNPQISPAAPLPGQSFTATVFVVAQPLPTQVVMRAVMGGVTTNLIMHDNGTNGDATAGDQIYTTVANGQPNGTWVYYEFYAYGTNGTSFSLPASQTRYTPSPPLTVTMDGGGLSTTVQPAEQWTTYQTTGTVTSTGVMYLQLAGAGEALADDVVLKDAGGTNHIQNGTFDSPLSSGWITNGAESASYRDVLNENGTINGALHLVASSAITGWDNVGQNLPIPMVIGTTGSLSFRTRQVSQQVLQWYSLLIGTAPPDVVVNEIMYRGIQTNEAPYQYVELYNPTSGSVDLSGWSFVGISFVVPTGTVLAAGGYLVVCADTNTIHSTYGITNIIGNWASQLNDNGQTISLVNQYGRAVDSVPYDNNPPWPVAANGLGPSLERLSATDSGSDSRNWVSSRASTNWQQVVWTGQISSANTGLRFFLDAEGKCWLDDVSVKRVGSSTEIVTNGSFEAGTNRWTFIGNHSQSKIEPGMGRTNGAALAVVGNETRWIIVGGYPVNIMLAYGDPASNAVCSTPLPTVNGSNYVVSCWVRREGLVGNFIEAIGSHTNIVVPLSNYGTPGRANSATAPTLPVGIASVTNLYSICPTGTANVVVAQLTGSAGVTNVQLYYRVVTSNGYSFADTGYTNLAMRDDGVFPDAVAGDGLFSVLMPAVTSEWSLVRYHVTAVGTNGFVVQDPPPDDPSTDNGYWVQTRQPQTALPNWQVMTDGGPVVYPIGTHACALSPDGQVFVDVDVRHRGAPPDSSDPAVTTVTGLALRFNKGRWYKAWFATKQHGINFRNRGNDDGLGYRRVINEPISYALQSTLGLAAPRLRHVCVWINGGAPTITTELEDPQDEFLSGNGISSADYVSRSSWSGRNITGGNPALDNFDTVGNALTAATNATKTVTVRTNLNYESVQHCFGLLGVTCDGDQNLVWNMFEHRSATDGRWDQCPWDVDMSFDMEGGIDTNAYPYFATTTLHPYYQTPLHPGVYETNSLGSTTGQLLGNCLFYPETGPGSIYTLPYRYRQQMTLWRLCYTLFTTNYLGPQLDQLQQQLLPAYAQIGVSAALMTQEVASVKTFIAARRNLLINGTWSDKMTNIWVSTNVYNPATVVINEIMCAPPAGGSYVEFYNKGYQPIDLSWWTLQAGSQSYRLPQGAMLGATSYLVVAGSELALTNTYAELGSPNTMVSRYFATPLWDWPVVWTSATEYATRVVEIPPLTLPAAGTTLTLFDLASNAVSTVAYGSVPPWPTNTSASLELIDPALAPGAGSSWRACTVVGTPGGPNSATLDEDGDGMPDAWEQRIVAASTGRFTNVSQVLPWDDFDGDGIPNIVEFLAGTDPTVPDAGRLAMDIGQTNGTVQVRFNTIPVTGGVYALYQGRYYTLESSTNLPSASGWNGVTNYIGLFGSGNTLTFTNQIPAAAGFYRARINLQPIR